MKNRTTTPKFIAQSVRFPMPLYKRIKTEAVRRGLSVSDIVRLAVMETLSSPAATAALGATQD